MTEQDTDKRSARNSGLYDDTEFFAQIVEGYDELSQTKVKIRPKTEDQLSDVTGADEVVAMKSFNVDSDAVLVEPVSEGKVTIEGQKEDARSIDKSTLTDSKVVYPKRKKVSDDDIYADRKEETLAFFVEAVVDKYNESDQNKDRTDAIEGQIVGLEGQRQLLISRLSEEAENEYHNMEERAAINKQFNQEGHASFANEIENEQKSYNDYAQKYELATQNRADLFEKLENLSSNNVNSNKKSQLKAKIEDYDRYIAKLSAKLDDLKERIDSLSKSNEELDLIYAREVKQLLDDFSKKYGAPREVDNEMRYYAEDHPDVRVYDDQISELRRHQELLRTNPQEIYANIVKLMEDRVEPSEVNEQLKLLTEILGSDTVHGILPWIRSKHAEIVSSVESMKQEKADIDRKLAGENGNKYLNYFRYNEKRADDAELSRLLSTLENSEKELEILNAENNYYKQQGAFENNKRAHDRLLKQIESETKEKEELAITEDDKELFDTTIKALEAKEKMLKTKIEAYQAAKPSRTQQEVTVQINELQRKIREISARIEVLKNKDADEYIDYDEYSFDEDMSSQLETRIALGIRRSKHLESVPVDELMRMIVDDYKKSLTETPIIDIDLTELDDYDEEPSPSLLERISSNEFVSKMSGALKGFASALTSNKKAKKEDKVETPDNEPVVYEEKAESNEKISTVSLIDLRPGKFYVKLDEGYMEIGISQVVELVNQNYTVVSTRLDEHGNVSISQFGQSAVEATSSYGSK